MTGFTAEAVPVHPNATPINNTQVVVLFISASPQETVNYAIPSPQTTRGGVCASIAFEEIRFRILSGNQSVDAERAKYVYRA
jgi:hypothetical protein